MQTQVASFKRLITHLLCHMFGAIRFADAGQAKVADLQHTVAVDKQVTRLDVPMEDVGGVQVLKSAQDLVQKYLDVVRGQVLV